MRLLIPIFMAAILPFGCVEYGVKSFGMGGISIHEELGSSERQTDAWEATGTDLIFFGDTSDSMFVELQTMGENALSFMDHLDDYDSGWQILVVTGWDGCGVNGIISADVPDYDTLFAEALVTPPEQDAIDAGADEWGLYNTDMAVQESGSGGCNEGFLRESSLLHVIFLSDEDDTSPGWDGADPTYWQTYVDNVIAAKASEPLVTFSAIVGPSPEGCDGAYPGTNYISAVEHTEGSILSICEDWYNQLDVLVYASVQIFSFPLSRHPVSDSIRVTVAGEERDSGWAYVSAGNLVHFSEEPPTVGQAVSISYEVSE